MVRAMLEKLWEDSCTVYIREKTTDATTKRTVYADYKLYENQPCKLSFETLTSTTEADHTPLVVQRVKLFVGNELDIPAGSKIVITRNNKTYTYKASGEPGVFTHHQEILLEQFEGWA